MGKSQINQLSKRQILESLYQEQNQSNVTLSRLITAVARSIDIDPVRLAEMFTDDKGNQAFVEKFNEAVKEKHATAHTPTVNPDNVPNAALADTEQITAAQTSEPSNEEAAQ